MRRRRPVPRGSPDGDSRPTCTPARRVGPASFGQERPRLGTPRGLSSGDSQRGPAAYSRPWQQVRRNRWRRAEESRGAADGTTRVPVQASIRRGIGRSPASGHPKQTYSGRYGADITYMLHRQNVTWAYYVAEGMQPDCADGQTICLGVPQEAQTPDIWNPLPGFDTVRSDHEQRNVQPLGGLFSALKSGHLPNVSWVVPDDTHSEHPAQSIHAGQAYV